MSLFTTTFRDNFGHDVSPTDPTCTYLQVDADFGLPQGAFTSTGTTAEATWHGVHIAYSAFNPGIPAPAVGFVSRWRITLSGPVGPPNDLDIVIHSILGDLVVLSDGSVIIVSNGMPMSPVVDSLIFDSGYVGVSELVGVFDVSPSLVIAGRGIPLNVPSARRWELQKAAVRGKPEEMN